MITAEEKLVLYVHLTLSGQPEDSSFIGTLDTTKDFTVGDVKEMILEMPKMNFAKEAASGRLRLRTKQQSMYFGEIYKNNDLTLKKAGIRPNQPIVA